MADVQINVPFIDGLGAPREQLSVADAFGDVSPQTALRINGGFVSTSNPMPVTSAPTPGTFAAGTLTCSTSSQQVFGSNASRIRYRVENVDYATASGGSSIAIWGCWGAPAVVRGPGCFLIQPGQLIEAYGTGVNENALNAIAESGTPDLYWETF